MIQTGVRVAARAVASLLQAIFLVLLARNLSISEFGGFSAQYAILTLVAASVSFGSTARALRIKLEIKPTVILGRIICLRIIGSLIIIISTIVLSFAIPLNASLLLLGLCLSISDYWVDLAQAILSGTARQVSANIMIVSQRVLFMIAGVVWNAVNSDSDLLLISCCIVATFVSLGASIYITWTKLENPFAREDLKALWGYWIAGVSGNLRQLEPPIVSGVMGTTVAGAYAVGFRITNPIQIFPVALQSVFLPKLAASNFERDSFIRIVKYSSIMVFCYAGVLIAGATLWAQILVVFVGASYAIFSNIFSYFFIAAGLYALVTQGQTILYAASRPAFIGIVVVFSEALSLIAIILFSNSVNFIIAVTVIGTPLLQIVLILPIVLRELGKVGKSDQ